MSATAQITKQSAISLFNLFKATGVKDAALFDALAAAGRRHEAIQIAEALQATSRKRYVSPYGLAQIYAALQREEETFKWLQAAHQDRAVWMGYLAVDPVFHRYRADKRFQELVRQVGVPSDTTVRTVGNLEN